MMRIQRVLFTLSVVGVVLSMLAGMAQSQDRLLEETYTISGSTGLPGVTMQGLPEAIVTDSKGVYTVNVPEGWAGEVRPTKDGYTFSPPARQYPRVKKDYTEQNFRSSIVTFTIEGSTGAPGVVMKGLPGDPITDTRGYYTVKVDYGWAGTVTPMKEGYVFEPARQTYRAVTRQYTDQNYKARVLTFTISGNAGVGGARLLGLPGAPVSDPEGLYAVEVPYGWAGRITPMKVGYSFEPPQRLYQRIKESQRGADFEAKMLTYRITGEVGLEGVSMQGLPGEPISDTRGYYTATVPYGWTGTVSPRKRGCQFDPPRRAYGSVKADMQDQDYKVVGLRVATPTSYGGSGWEVLVIPGSEVDPKQVAQTKEDLQVMLEILREKLSESRTIMGVLHDYGEFFSSGGSEALYLEGYGVLFVLRVDFPFSSLAEEPAEPRSEAKVDPVWQRARQRLYTPSGVPGYRRGGASPGGDEMSFEQFKEDLVTALKHAANIHHIASSDKINLTVISQDSGGLSYGYGGTGEYYGGGTGFGYGTGGRSASGGSFGRGGGSTHGQSGEAYGSSDAPQTSAADGYGNVKRDALGDVIYRARPALTTPTVLTMQTTKADVDAFAAGEIDLEQFRSRVKIFSY